MYFEKGLADRGGWREETFLSHRFTPLSCTLSPIPPHEKTQFWGPLFLMYFGVCWPPTPSRQALFETSEIGGIFENPQMRVWPQAPLGLTSPPLSLPPFKCSGCRQRGGGEFKGGSLHDSFGGFDSFGGSGKHLALLSLVLQITGQRRNPWRFGRFWQFRRLWRFRSSRLPP